MPKLILSVNDAQAIDYDKLLNYSLRILAKKRYTTLEIKNKCGLYLRKKKMEGREQQKELIDKVIKRLLELKYLDDESYSTDYINEKVKFRPKGKFLLKRELKLKGIPEEVIDNILEKQQIDELELAETALKKRRQRWKDLPLLKQRNRAASFLASRGFRPEIVYKTISSCYNTDESGI